MSSLTERALAASLKKLLEKKTLDKITVKDITDDCGVNRQTFYYHFHDVYDLVEWIFLEEARKFRSKYEGERDLKVVVSKLTEQLLENKAFIINAFYSVNRRQLEKFLQELARPALTDIAASYAEGRHISQETGICGEHLQLCADRPGYRVGRQRYGYGFYQGYRPVLQGAGWHHGRGASEVFPFIIDL